MESLVDICPLSFFWDNLKLKSLLVSVSDTLCDRRWSRTLRSPDSSLFAQKNGKTMFCCRIFLVVSLANFLRDLHVSSCDPSCAEKPEFTPSRLVVKYGDATSARCSVCESCSKNIYNLERALGSHTINGTTIVWKVEKMTEWDTNTMCYFTNDTTNHQCCTTLPITVYKPPDRVSISFLNHTGPMFMGHDYALQCEVQNVAPVEKLSVTFYRGQTALTQLQSNNTHKKPVTEIFSLSITPRKEDNGVQYWCEAKLELGPEGPELPPLVTSQRTTATVFYKPHLETSDPETVTITEGQRLQLNCTSVGNPSPSYTWKIPPASPSPWNSSVITIESVTFEHGGWYTCDVRNSVGKITVMYNVDVKADITPYIIYGVVGGGLLLIFFTTIVLIHCYKHNRMGQYNLKDVFRLHTRHVAVPITE
ncbi:vascular cell adhesion protein 1-like [Seriola lalandi dorsalis]|uniref:Vascular cell adhesion protein 1-like n=2 Tax=Seriola lalandi dorsalis TaxID=1841481 RepID=A0A3B4X1A4_SERLL|nr:vascular cell adhesion protein 1-like [Seriola lalandi dorsalis]